MGPAGKEPSALPQMRRIRSLVQVDPEKLAQQIAV